MEDSSIQKFYKNQTIFITGGTGFVGKVVIEKLLRVCDVNKIYILVRSKKNKTPQQRFNELFSIPCFDRLKRENVEYKSKVFLINGDCDERKLGLSEEDRSILCDEVTLIIHAAADVKFNQPLRTAAVNLICTMDILDLARKMPKLKGFVHVSTAYSNCIHSHIKESFYDPPMTAENFLKMVNCLDDEVLEVARPHLLKDTWPNTYVYIKSIIEDLLRRTAKDLPLIIVRPAIIVCSAEEPMPGWVDNFYGVIGLANGASLGVIKSLLVKFDEIAQFVPVDYVSNYILAAAWAIEEQKSEDITVYNFAGHNNNLLPLRRYMDILNPKLHSIITEKQIFYYTCVVTESELIHKLRIFFLHTCLAYVGDLVLVAIGRKPSAVKSYKKINTNVNLLSYFSTRSWKFDQGNMIKLWALMSEQDKKLFNFDMEKLDWEKYLETCAIGSRVYLLKDPLETIPRALKKQKLLMIAHYLSVFLFWYLVYKLCACIVRLFTQ